LPERQATQLCRHRRQGWNLDWREILAISRFYLPLAATSILMMSSHSIVSGALARAYHPAVAMAAYSAALSIGQLFESPTFGIQRMVVSLTEGPQSFWTTARVAACILAGILFLMGAVGYSPLAAWLFGELVGLEGDALIQAITCFRIFMLWPTFVTLRGISQGLLVLSKKTYWLTANMLVRVTAMMALAAVLPRLLEGASVGAAVLMAGIGIEAGLSALVVAAVGRHFWSSASESGPAARGVRHREPLPAWYVVRFFAPVAAASLVQTASKPALAAGLGRTTDPVLALAAYQVAMNLAFIFSAISFNIHQVVVVYGREARHPALTRTFCLAVGLLGTLALGLLAFTPAGLFVLEDLIGAPADVVRQATVLLRWLVPLPLVTTVTEYYYGLLLLARRTKPITAAKLAYALTGACAYLGLAGCYPELGGLIGALGTVLAIVVEALVARRHALAASAQLA